MANPAFVNWVLMVKGDEEKMVHPGNVANHEHFGWVRKYPEPAQEAPVDDKAYQSLTLPELTEMIVEHETDEAAVSTETDVPSAEDPAKASGAGEPSADADTGETADDSAEEESTNDLSVLVKPDAPRKRTPRKAKK